ncbi:MAG: hypothetical protein WKF42_03950 [Solirubrobacteraceae bacterium]
MTEDPALAEALDRAAALAPTRVPAVPIVHDLATRGVQALLADRRRDTDAIERLVEPLDLR